MNDDQPVADALHAAATWLQRQSLPPRAMAVVRLRPTAAVGHWQPGDAITWLSTIDDAGAELADAAAPLVQAALQRLAPAARVAALTTSDAELLLLLAPAAGRSSMVLSAAAGSVELVDVHLATMQ